MLWITLLILMIVIAAAPVVPMILEHYAQTTPNAHTSDVSAEPSQELAK